MELDASVITQFTDRISTVGWVVLAILFVMSIASWVVIVSKWMALRRAGRVTQQFEDVFWSGGDLSQLMQTIEQRGPKSAIERVFQAGYREFGRLRKLTASRADMVDVVTRNMNANVQRELDGFERQLPYLATAGSSSPYIGLFGTVIGIMVALISLEGKDFVSISVIAPAIAEPLIATAAGLFVAIPAVIGYNSLMTRVDRLESRLNIFTEEFTAVLERNMHPAAAPQQVVT